MDLLRDVKYKDELPVNTINIIRSILNDLGILTTERCINPIGGLYSTRVEIAGTNIGTNGKGTTYEYALASAYAEFMERLQNQVLYHCAGTEIHEYKDFYFAPDEKHMTIEEMERVSNDTGKVLFPPISVKNSNEVTCLARVKVTEWFPDISVREEKYRLFENWEFYPGEGEPSCFTAVPLYKVNDDSIYHFPSQFIRLAYGSNGMCAGNTSEEALVQGISEIIERHVNLMIIKKKIVPPTIPIEYISKFPRIYNLVKQIEQRNDKYKLIFKDCSLGQGFPAVGLIIVNPKNQKYMVKFGAHPVMEIAMERCLTELFQGKDMISIDDYMLEFRYFNYEMVEHPSNIRNILTIGIGYYPYELFSGNYSYEFSEFKDVTGMSNTKILHFLTHLLLDKGYDIYIRDVSFLGFPSFHVFIPGMSELVDYNSKTISALSQKRKISKKIRNLNSASEQDLKDIISYLKQKRHVVGEADYLARLLTFPVSKTFPWMKIHNYLFISAAYCKMRMYKEASEAIDNFISIYPRILMETGGLFYRGLKDCLEMLANGVDEKEIHEVLSVFYQEEIVGEVISYLRNPEEIFKNYGTLNCWNCAQCTFQSDCHYELVKKLHIALKDKYAGNIIDQSNLRKLFN